MPSHHIAKAFSLTAVLFIFAACAPPISLQHSSVETNLKPKHVCLERNPKVTRTLTTMLVTALEKRGITTEMVTGGGKPETCEYVLNYVIRQSLARSHETNRATYISRANIQMIKREKGQVASVAYTGKVDPVESNVEIMDAIVDNLLGGKAELRPMTIKSVVSKQ
jgi:hypothetical protein